MAKQLIESANVDEFICHEEKKFYLDLSRMVLTPGAKDLLRRKNIEIVYCEVQESPADVPAAPSTATSGNLSETVAVLLKQDYAITDADQVERITREVLSRLNG